MATTIQVSNETKMLLDRKKKATKKTYDKIVQELLKKDQDITALYGKYNLKEWNKKNDRVDIDART